MIAPDADGYFVIQGFIAPARAAAVIPEFKKSVFGEQVEVGAQLVVEVRVERAPREQRPMEMLDRRQQTHKASGRAC